VNEQVKQIAEKTQYSIYFSGIWQGVTDKFAEAIVKDCIERIGNLKGSPDKTDWDTAIEKAQELLTAVYLKK